MDTCERCGADLGVGRFCLNCGHRIGAPLPPHEEFLPWVETAPAAAAEAPPSPAPPSSPSPRWGRWVVAAIVLLGLFVALLSWLPGRGDDGADDGAGDTASETGGGLADPDRPKASNVARRALVRVPETAPPSTDLDGTRARYGARRMLDGKPTTAWRMEGDGTGADISFRLESRTRIQRVGLINGYAKRVEGVDWYPNNRRVLRASWTFDDGTVVNQPLTARRTMQRMRIEPVATRTVTLTLAQVSPPGQGELGRDYTAVSEVVLIGRPAD